MGLMDTKGISGSVRVFGPLGLKWVRLLSEMGQGRLMGHVDHGANRVEP